MTELPETVPGRTYLLAYDRDRGRLAGRMWLGYTLRAAVLAELWATGQLIERDGRPSVPPTGRPPTDPVLREVWQEIADDKPRRWDGWIKRNRGGTEAAIRRQLATQRFLRVEREPTWWRPAKIEITDSRVHTRLDARVGATLRGPMPIDRVDARDAAVIAVLVTGDVRTGVSKLQRREYADRITAAITRCGPPVAGLKRALRQARSQIS